MEDSDVRLGMLVSLPEHEGSIDNGHVVEWDGGWFVIIEGGELTGPWSADDLTRS